MKIYTILLSQDFDLTNCGRLAEANFRRCLDMMGVGEAGTRRYNLTTEEMEDLVDAYRDPLDPSRCLWREFEDDIERGRWMFLS